MNLSFTLSEDMVRQLASLLSEHPYRISAPILAELQRQITAQQNPPNLHPVEVAENK